MRIYRKFFKKIRKWLCKSAQTKSGSKSNSEDFFSRTVVEYGIGQKKVHTVPPYYYEFLEDGFLAYYNTFRKIRSQGYAHMCNFPGYDDTGINYMVSNETLVCFISFHRFFELLIKDILFRIDEKLVYNSKNEQRVNKFIRSGKISKIENSDQRTIEFLKAYNRLISCISFAEKNPTDLKLKSVLDFKFLLDLGFLPRLNNIRNRIYHKGSIIPNIYQLDYLVSRKIIRAVDQVLKLEIANLGSYKPRFKFTPSNKNLFDEFLKVKYEPADFENPKKVQDLCRSLFLLGHLKEIGRCSAMYEFSTITQGRPNSMPYDVEGKSRNIKFAEIESNSQLAKAIKKCPCCSELSCVVYAMTLTEVVWVKCYNCSYNITANMFEPKDFELNDEYLFKN